MDAKEERFKKVAQARVNAVLDKLRLLGQCGNRKNYTYSDQQVEAMFKVVGKAMRESKSAFTADTKRNRFLF